MKVNISKIEKEMKRLGWSVATLAEKAGLSRQTIYDRLKSNTGGNMQTVDDIAKALNMDGKELLE